MSKIKKIAPWEYFEEDDIFAVQNTATGELGFVSIMGAIGEHFAIAVYLGEQGLYGFWDLHESLTDELSYNKVFEVPQLQASFENRNMLQPHEHKLIKNLGLFFQGKNSWPMFRSIHSGYYPWYLDSKEALFLQYVLEQTIDVITRCEDDFSLLMPGDDDTYFLRKGTEQGGTMVWQDSTLTMIPQMPIKEIAVDMQAIGTLKKLVSGDISLEIDLFMMNEPLQDKKDARPYFPYVLLMIDEDTGDIVNFRLLQPLPSFESMWGSVPAEITNMLAQLKILPLEIFVSSERLYQLLSPVTKNLHISLELVEKLPDIDNVRNKLMDFM